MSGNLHAALAALILTAIVVGFLFCGYLALLGVLLLALPLGLPEINPRPSNSQV